jgi:hypothetical protein
VTKLAASSGSGNCSTAVQRDCILVLVGRSIAVGTWKHPSSGRASSNAVGSVDFIPMDKPIPTSCAHLDLSEVERELIRRDCNVSAAAKSLGVPVHDLRLLTRARPKLMEAAFEAVERSLDEAEATMRDAMRNGDARQRVAAAGYLLRNTEAGRRRGW